MSKMNNRFKEKLKSIKILKTSIKLIEEKIFQIIKMI
jgi:hypothetical protein